MRLNATNGVIAPAASGRLGINEVFETPYGTVSIVADASEHDVGSPEGTRIRIAIGCPTEYLRACAASGRFDDELNRLLEIVELFEQLG
ncbi:hypothetical protein IU501_30510 [Nocardia otitidiscaviarum]|uniref:hypothetical protein n=1 Tax=Nocardia otitidiscaviarum TaxID=1823 RepID=UPI0004A6C8D6|nr:hypothetical protein [Nocardia otitidiscaviarum]MBF6137313.1 hypothetical protein [Nocardia otitidiscaviarum]MBF6488422.1 hypothetical protein [Nocardia otitidiscaviarum]